MGTQQVATAFPAQASGSQQALRQLSGLAEPAPSHTEASSTGRQRRGSGCDCHRG